MLAFRTAAVTTVAVLTMAVTGTAFATSHSSHVSANLRSHEATTTTTTSTPTTTSTVLPIVTLLAPTNSSVTDDVNDESQTDVNDSQSTANDDQSDSTDTSSTLTSGLVLSGSEGDQGTQLDGSVNLNSGD